jgi:photosystem II stability/assembly factor-like uncharacterized protein
MPTSSLEINSYFLQPGQMVRLRKFFRIFRVIAFIQTDFISLNKPIMKFILFTSILFLTLFSTRSAFGQWVETPVQGEITCLAVSDTDTSSPVLFAATFGRGIFRSTDNGTSWEPANNGLTNLNVENLELSVAGVLSPVLFASTAEQGAGVFRTLDNGASWQMIDSGLTNLNLDAFAVSGMNLYVAGNGGGVYLSTNNGISWNTANTGLSQYLTVLDFAVGGTYAMPMLFAGTYQYGVYLANGKNWTPVNNGLGEAWVSALAVTAGNSSSPILFAGTTGYIGMNGGVFRSTDNGTSWTSESTGLLNSDVYTLFPIGTNLFAGTNNGIFLSTDSGASWISENAGLKSKLISSFAAIDGNLFVGTDSTNSSGYTVGGSVWKRPLSEMIPNSAVTGNPGGPLFQYLYIDLYPTPTSKTLNVELDGMYIAPAETLTCGLYDILGRHMLDLTNEAQRGNNGYTSVF